MQITYRIEHNCKLVLKLDPKNMKALIRFIPIQVQRNDLNEALENIEKLKGILSHDDRDVLRLQKLLNQKQSKADKKMGKKLKNIF